MRFFLFSCIWLLLIPTVHAGENSLLVGDFSTFPMDGDLPEFWQPLVFDGVDIHTTYTHLLDGDRGVIGATSVAGSSGLVRKIVISPKEFPRVSWSWKIANIIEDADLSKKSGDDAPARLYVTFAYDSSEVSFWERIKFETIKLFYGEYPPIGALTYVWASHMPKGTVLENPYTSRVKMIVVQSGDEKKGEWLAEERNINEDYRMAFGTSETPQISGVAIMTDTDNTESKAVAWYGDIIFSK